MSEKAIKQLAKEKLRKEFDQMDFEDLVGGDLPTRFSYVEVCHLFRFVFCFVLFVLFVLFVYSRALFHFFLPCPL